MNIVNINLWNLQALLLDFAIIFLLFISLRFIKGLISNVKATDEIASRDNFAFGVSFAGGIAALAIMLTGVMVGDFADTLQQEAINMAMFGILGLFLITVGRLLQDKIALSQVSLHDEIARDNLAAAVVDLGHAIAIGIVCRAAMLWVETEGVHALPVIVAGFVVSQIILTIASRYRIKLFAVNSESEQNCMQQALEAGNTALAVRYAGYLIGVSLAITAASGFVEYDPDAVWHAVVIWGMFAILLSVIFALIKLIAIKAILPGVNISDEVDRQKNLGVAAIETAVSIAIGLTLATLFG